jgi:two-component system chemotaxis response regulator CheB
MVKKKIKVLIVDDSAVIRESLARIFNADPEIEVIGSASNPYMAVKKIKTQLPDVISLDIEMPGMDGLTFLRKIMAQHPIPVMIVSSLTEKGSAMAIQALQMGAVQVVVKPKIHTAELLQESAVVLCNAIKAASYSKIKKRSLNHDATSVVPRKFSADVILQPKAVSAAAKSSPDKIIAIGASTGGTEALRQLLTAMPEDGPGILVAQHMPEFFTRSFAERLNQLCHIEVKEAEEGDIVMRGFAFIAPGNKHMLIERLGLHYKIRLHDGPLVNRHRPSVDVLFRSVAQSAGSNATGVILTGMGDDGARGLLELRQAGGFTMAQDEETCVVFGMPKEAIEMNAVDLVLPLPEIAPRLMAMQTFKMNHKAERLS